MTRRPTTVERAFEIARSGRCRCLSELRLQLQREGYGDGRQHTDGRYIQRQLASLMDVANSAEASA